MPLELQLVELLLLRLVPPLVGEAPPSGVPGPVDAVLAQPIADRRGRLRRQQLLALLPVVEKDGLDRIDGVVSVAGRRDRAVGDNAPVRLDLRAVLARRVAPDRCAG